MAKIVMLGDSLTAGYGVRPQKGWAYQLRELYPEHDFFLRGVLGDTIEGMLERARICLQETQPDMLFLLGGSNDLLLGRNVEAVLHSIRQIHRLCQANQVRLILLICPEVTRHPGPYAWFPASEVEWLLDRFQRLGQRLREYARNCGLMYVDIPKIFAGMEEEEIFLEDGVHLTEAAHQKMAQFIFLSGIL